MQFSSWSRSYEIVLRLIPFRLNRDASEKIKTLAVSKAGQVIGASIRLTSGGLKDYGCPDEVHAAMWEFVLPLGSLVLPLRVSLSPCGQ